MRIMKIMAKKEMKILIMIIIMKNTISMKIIIIMEKKK
jgi:hypothetical protein